MKTSIEKSAAYAAALSLEAARAWLMEHDPAGAPIWTTETSVQVLRDNVAQNLREYGFKGIRPPETYEPQAS